MDKAKVGWFWTLDGGRPYEDLKSVAALFVVMPAHHLMYGNMCLETIKLKIHPVGMATFEKIAIYRRINIPKGF